jgi:cysteine desulfurase/selenocysteine lyase
MTGWRSVVHRDDYFCYDSPLREGGERFEAGSLNAVGLVGMEAAMEMLLSVSLANIEARILALNDYLVAGLQAHGCTITTPIAHRSERSGIICFHHPELELTTLAKRLRAAEVLVSLRGDVIRVSPHFFSNKEDLDRLLDVLTV